jgi:hypothetical protein
MVVGMKLEQDGTFHGGFVRDRGEGRGVRVAKAKVTELPPIDPQTVQEAALAISRPSNPETGQNPLAGRKTKLAVLGIPASVLDAGSPEYARCVRLAMAYKKARQKELFLAHGYVSSGVSALLAAASLALSASRFLYEQASSVPMFTADRGGTAMPQLLKLASSLSDSARQNELSAWELCAREAVIRKRNDAANQGMPWMTAETEERKKPGRPRKVDVVISAAEDASCPTSTENS